MKQCLVWPGACQGPCLVTNPSQPARNCPFGYFPPYWPGTIHHEVKVGRSGEGVRTEAQSCAPQACSAGSPAPSVGPAPRA